MDQILRQHSKVDWHNEIEVHNRIAQEHFKYNDHSDGMLLSLMTIGKKRKVILDEEIVREL